MERKGIDLSTHNGAVDWNKVNGIDFAILRTGYGWEDWENQTDKRFHANKWGADSRGIPTGCYHYSYATTVDEVRREAEFLNHIIRGYTFQYPVALDLEDKVQRNLSRKALTDVAVAFCDEMERSGWFPAIYANLDWVRNRLDMSRLKSDALWLAQYNDHLSYPDCGIWQYTSTGRVSGVSGTVDRNLAFYDYPSIIREQGKNGLVTSGEGYLLLDTREYFLPPGGVYDVKATLYGAPYSSLKVYSSRDGIASVTKLDNQKYRVLGLREGVCYIVFEVWADGNKRTHASVKITVQNGVTPHGTPNSAPSTF